MPNHHSEHGRIGRQHARHCSSGSRSWARSTRSWRSASCSLPSTPSYDLPVALAIVIAPPSVPGLVVPMRVTFVSDDAFVASR